MCDDWASSGIKSIDMETSVVVAVANHFKVSAVSMLSAWDVLKNNKTFLDPLSDEDTLMLQRSNEQIYNVALSLAEAVQDQRSVR